MALSAEERAKVRYHLGYLNTSAGAAISLGVPSANQTGFILESAMNTILPESEFLVRRAVAELDCIEGQLSEARTRLSTQKVDEIVFRGDETDQLESQYDYWSKTLADIFGVPINPFSKKHQRLAGEVFVIEPT